ncbi:MAG: peptidoglycan-binding protein [Jatrophihabitans sp.]
MTTPGVAGSAGSAEQFTADLTTLLGTSSTIGSLAGKSSSTVSDLGTLALDVVSFAQIGSTVGAVNTSLQSTLSQALSKVTAVLHDVGQALGTSAQGYSAADQAVAQSLGAGATGTGTAATGDGVAALLKGHHQGDKGADVLSLQQKLTAAGYDTHGTDGVWGKNTQAAVAAYQHDHPDAVPVAAAGSGQDPAGWTQHYTSPSTHPAVVGHTRVGGKQVPTYDMTGHQPPATAPAGNLSSWIAQAKTVLRANGYDTSKMSDHDLGIIINGESGGHWNDLNNYDRNALDGIPSKGLMQTIDQTFNTYSVPGHRDVWNPVDNIVSGVRYATARYGSLRTRGVISVDNGGPYIGY